MTVRRRGRPGCVARTVRRGVVATALVTSASLLPPGSNAFATSAPAQATTAPSAAHASTAASSVSPNASCPVTRGAHTGAYICSTTGWDYWFSNGIQQTFVIGLDNGVWTTWQRFPGDTIWTQWQPLPPNRGRAIAGILPVDNTPTIAVVGTDGNWWCDRRSPSTGQWSGWFRC